MQKSLYKKPNTKVHVPRFELLQIPLYNTSNPNTDIESKSVNMVEDNEGETWGKVWGRADEE